MELKMTLTVDFLHLKFLEAWAEMEVQIVQIQGVFYTGPPHKSSKYRKVNLG